MSLVSRGRHLPSRRAVLVAVLVVCVGNPSAALATQADRTLPVATVTASELVATPDPAAVAASDAGSELEWMWLKQSATEDWMSRPVAGGSMYYISADSTGQGYLNRVDGDGRELLRKPHPTGGLMALTSTHFYVAADLERTQPQGRDASLRKYDLQGNLIWAREFGSHPDGTTPNAADEFVADVAVDPSGVYVAGTTYGSFPGFSLAGSSDVFVRKYDHVGTWCGRSSSGRSTPTVRTGASPFATRPGASRGRQGTGSTSR